MHYTLDHSLPGFHISPVRMALLLLKVLLGPTQVMGEDAHDAAGGDPKMTLIRLTPRGAGARMLP